MDVSWGLWGRCWSRLVVGVCEYIVSFAFNVWRLEVLVGFRLYAL